MMKVPPALKRTLVLGSCLGLICILLLVLERFGVSSKEIVRRSLIAMTPLALAATGECLNQKAGIVNIGLEGIFLLSCVGGVLGAERLGGWAVGLLVGALTGAFISFILGAVSVYVGANQIVAGMGINVFGIGMIAFFLMEIWAFPGIHPVRSEFYIPTIDTRILGLLNLVVFIALALPFLVYLILNKTFLGIKIRAAGEKPEAVDVAGQDVGRIRMYACIFGGALAGLGGVFLALGWHGTIVKEIAAGRGFIALACVVFAGLNPILALAASFIFGFTEALAYVIKIAPGAKAYAFLPYFLDMLPYIIPLLVVAIFIGKRPFPRALGKPYIRE